MENHISISCELPTNRGDFSTDILMLKKGDTITFILATTARQDAFRLRMAPDMHSQEWSRNIPSVDVARSMMMWANNAIKSQHIKSHCDVDDHRQIVREIVLSISSADFIHPGAITSDTADVIQADLRPSSTCEDGNLRSMEISSHDHQTPSDTVPPHRNVAIVTWDCPLGNMIRVPYPYLLDDDGNMNATVMSLGPIVHENFNSGNTYPHTVKGDMLDSMGIFGDFEVCNRSTITYIQRCTRKNHVGVLNFPTRDHEGMRDGRTVVFLNGTIACDRTRMRIVRFTEYKTMIVPLVVGFPVVNSVRFERAFIPYVVMPDRVRWVTFEDDNENFGNVLVSENGLSYGRINVLSRETRNGLTWLHLVHDAPLPIDGQDEDAQRKRPLPIINDMPYF
jgi:hypothetical protein